MRALASRRLARALALAALLAVATLVVGGGGGAALAADGGAAGQVEQLVAARLGVPPEALRVEGFEAPFGLDAGERLIVDDESLSGPLVGSIAVRARTTRAGAADRHVSLRGKVAVRRERLRVARALPRGTVLTPSDVVADLVWDDGSEVLPEAEEVIGLETRRAIPLNQALRATDLGEPTMVKRGQPVKIDYVSPGITVVGVGRAIGDGRRGDLVRVEMPGAARVIVAKVVSQGWVRASPESAAVTLGARR